MKNKSGFSLIEIMVVIAIIAILTTLAIPNFTRFLAKTKRSEAYLQLRNIYLSEKVHFMENQEYTNKLSGTEGLGWDQEKGVLYYTYGFSGGEGKNYVSGSLKSGANKLSGSYADENNFKAYAVGDIDNDGKFDVLSVDKSGVIKIEMDDLE